MTMAQETHTITTIRFDASTNTYHKQASQRHLGASEVLIKTTHSGICFTDVHAKSKGCGLGHEGIGQVVKTGSAVRGFSIGDRVGWGWLHHYCAEARGFAFGELDQGAFGDFAIWNEDFVYGIPDEIESRHAGPLMCAGASVYEALDVAGTKPSDTVGVVGIGGLGHMAIIFAKSMGCGVTALSSSAEKRERALKLGATGFWNTTLKSGINHESPINVLLVCSNEVDLEPLMHLLARRATIVLMTIQQKPLSIPYMQFILPGHRLIASTEASRRNHIEMLKFVARHGIKPKIEEFPMTLDGVAEAFQRLEEGKMRYRGVLCAQ